MNNSNNVKSIQDDIVKCLRAIRPDRMEISPSEYQYSFFGKELRYRMIDIAYMIMQLSEKYSFQVDAEELKKDAFYTVQYLSSYIDMKSR